MSLSDEIRQRIETEPVILWMKGTPEQPACGFSARVAHALDALGVEYASVDVLTDPRIRKELSAVSDWPTIPQLFVRGELVGGCDIVLEMRETGELAALLGVEDVEAVTPGPVPASLEVVANSLVDERGRVVGHAMDSSDEDEIVPPDHVL